MKFTEGYWVKKEGFVVEHPRQIQDIEKFRLVIRVYSPTRVVREKGDELDSPMLTTTLEPVSKDIIKVSIEHFQGTKDEIPQFKLNYEANDSSVDIHDHSATIRSGSLYADISGEDHYKILFRSPSEELTSVIYKSSGIVTDQLNNHYMHEQLTLDVGEAVFGLGERFGPVNKNGQTVELWNDDGGTATEHAYKNIPFYFTNKGYGVFINHPEHVSLEVGSEINTRVQFSVPGQKLEYYVIYGPTPKEVLSKYTSLTRRPPEVPRWSYGLWLSTSFTTDYREETVMQFIDKMEELDLPLTVFHFDCYWMRPSHWCDFVWDPEKFPDPQGMLERLEKRGIKTCVWINPYIAQRSKLFHEGKERGYLLKSSDGSIRQWDHWQSGMAWVDFTNPEARNWWKQELKNLLHQGVKAFKTDFGERVPTDVIWFDGSDPFKMHNYYTYLYNQTAYEAISEVHGEEEAIVFARSATAGGQAFPVHWGGDSEPTFVSMAESLRGGLSLGLSGFGYWSHDMGGFEGTPDDDVFIRWFPFGMLSSHSRLHGSHSYRVPWNYGDKAVQVAKRFIAIKNRLMPYIISQSKEIVSNGTPLLRHMILEYPKDRNCLNIDTQYMFGENLLVCPVFHSSGEVEFYLPTDGWTDILNGEHFNESGWKKRVCDLNELPVLVPDNTVLPIGHERSKTEYDLSRNLSLYLFYPQDGSQELNIYGDGDNVTNFYINKTDRQIRVTCDGDNSSWRVILIGAQCDDIMIGDMDDSDIYEEFLTGDVIKSKENEVLFNIK